MIVTINGYHFPVFHMRSGLCIVKCVYRVGNETGCCLVNKIISHFYIQFMFIFLSKSLVSHRRVLGSIPGYFIWGFWYTKWHWDSFVSKSTSVSCLQWSILIFNYKLLLPEGKIPENLSKNRSAFRGILGRNVLPFPNIKKLNFIYLMRSTFYMVGRVAQSV
jgi:hypothetical protein